MCFAYIVLWISEERSRKATTTKLQRKKKSETNSTRTRRKLQSNFSTWKRQQQKVCNAEEDEWTHRSEARQWRECLVGISLEWTTTTTTIQQKQINRRGPGNWRYQIETENKKPKMRAKGNRWMLLLSMVLTNVLCVCTSFIRFMFQFAKEMHK